MVSVIVVNYNSHDKITRCVTSIFNGNIDIDVIVVDNASTDEGLSLLEASFPDDSRLQILRNQHNLGFAVGCNMGARLAKGQYLLYSNPDCLVAENTIQILRASLKKNSTVGMVGGLLLNSDGSNRLVLGAQFLLPGELWCGFVTCRGWQSAIPGYSRILIYINSHCLIRQ